jgi:predicted chitinase
MKIKLIVFNILVFFLSFKDCYRYFKMQREISKLLKKKAISCPKETAKFLAGMGIEAAAFQGVIQNN